MDFNFKLEKTPIMQAVKTARFPFFAFSNFLKNTFLVLFGGSLILFLLSFTGLLSGYLMIKVSALFLLFYIIFWDLDLFVRFRIKKIETPISSGGDVLGANTNFAQYLSFSMTEIAEKAIKYSKKKGTATSSASLLYFLLKDDKEALVTILRLGIDIKKAEADAKNYLEKNPKIQGQQVEFSDDFEDTIKQALEVAKERGNKTIGVKEVLVALAKNDSCFKKILIEYDLKEQDVENITLWLDGSEKMASAYGQFWSYENLARQGSLGKNWSSGYTVNLDKYATNWTNIVSKWNFHEIVGHSKEIESLEMILDKSKLSNALIIGDPGTGRKSIVEALAQKCFLGTTLKDLNYKKVMELDLVSLSAQVQNFEKLESLLDQIMYEVATAGNIILLINDLHNFVSQKVQKAGAVDISGVLAKYLALPNFKFIATTTFDGLHRNIEQNSSLLDFFIKIEVKEVSEDETVKILQTIALGLEAKSGVFIVYPAIREIVNLTSRYIPSLPFPKKALDVLDEAVVYVQTKKEKVLLPHHISEIISQKTEIPVGKMEVKEKETLLNLENLIHKRLVNQSEAVTEIAVAMRRARAGISSKKRPMGTFLFMGPTGVGKTEASKALAQIYFGSEEKMIRLDMSEFQDIADIPRLLGAVSPVEMQGLLTTPVRENPFSLVLLDEIEKAHPNILNLFLQVLDEGHITDGQGRKVVFTNTIIICTSNAGADIIFKEAEAGQEIDKQKLLDSIIAKGMFKPEFINRFDATVIFHPLTKENLLDIAQLTLDSLKKNLKEKEIDFEITDLLKAKIVELSYKPEYGAREMRRVVQDKVENAIAQALLLDKLKKTDHFTINPETFELIING